MSTYFALHFTHENAGVSADLWFAVLKLSTYSEVFGSKGLTRFSSFRFPCFMGFLRLDFVKLTSHALDAKFWEQREAAYDRGRSAGGKPVNVPSSPGLFSRRKISFSARAS